VIEDAVIVVESESGRRRVRLGDFLSPAEIERADREAFAWIKNARHADLDGLPLRDRLVYRGDSLWWFVEVYLHRMRVIETLLRGVTAAENLFTALRPQAVEMVSGDEIAGEVLAIGARRHGVVCRGVRPGLWRDARAFARTLAAAAQFVLRAVGSRLRHRAVRGAVTSERRPIAVFVHSAFWRDRAEREAYVGPILRQLVAQARPEDVVFVGLGPRTAFRARTLAKRLQEWQGTPPDVQSVEAYAPWPAITGSLAYLLKCGRIRRLLCRSRDLRQASVFGGYDLWRFIRRELVGTAYLQLPWSARAMDEAAAALDRIRPAVAVTYAEAGGWGRALVLEARRRGIPTCGLQHGFIHRHWLNYRHLPDEIAPSVRNPSDVGFPHPTATLLFDRFAARHLEEAGALPPAALIVTGNPRLDALASAARGQDEHARRETRSRFGAAADARLLVLATKYRERARDTLAALFDAVRAAEGVHLVVRCHPAETPEAYVKLAGSAPNITVAPGDVDLAATLAVADLVVTVNSTVALEAMALGVPALALNLPNYLSPFVEAGVMLGCSSPTEIAPLLRRFLPDEQARAALRTRQQAFMAEYEMLPTGQAADRAVGAILDVARSSGGLR
jgi:hypothetical protein